MMNRAMQNRLAALLHAAFFTMLSDAPAEPLVINIPPEPHAQETGYFKMGTARNPAGHEISVNSRSLLRDGEPWLPVMGEFHYARCPETEWRDELLKMRAGGISIVATYVFWIHHEEIEGEWDWAGRRNLRAFVKLAGELGLDVVVRCGPWCHGEVRNGGFPDWLVKSGVKLRTNDPAYLEKARELYTEIARQLKDLLWKDGGPVIGIQIENEYYGPAEHLLTLKKLAREVGLDVPTYTRTGWPDLTTPIPLGELLPLYGAYPEGFWDRALTPMPGDYWSKFRFSLLRTDTAIATDIFGKREAHDPEDTAKYPYLTCEIGGGMMNSYHRRVLINPKDIESIAVVKVGSGGSLPGYYMYHGGTNPDGKRTTLHESQETGYPNDLPVKSYDFQAPLGEFGQIRPHYHSLRRMHLFLRDFGARVATMPAQLPEKRPTSQDDDTTLRWATRSDGQSGLLFVNNYERLHPMKAKQNVQFAVKLHDEELLIPREPFTVPADSCFFWPFNFNVGGLKLIYVSAQPICCVEDDGVTYTFFAQTGDVPAEFVFQVNEVEVEAGNGEVTTDRDRIYVQKLKPGGDGAIRLRTKSGERHVIVLLDERTSLTCYKETWQGRERVFLTQSSLITDGNELRLLNDSGASFNVAIFPAPESVSVKSKALEGISDGIFRRFTVPVTSTTLPTHVEVKQIKPAGAPRVIPISKEKDGVAAAPTDADFEAAAVWRVKVPSDIEPSRNLVMRVHYAGDVARVYLDGKLLTDDFYNGNSFDIGLKRYAPDIYGKELLIKILPLRKDAPIYMAKEAWPEFGKGDSVLELKSVEIVEHHELSFTVE
jgi:beta-galactosidase